MEAKQPHQLTPKGRATRERILTLAAGLMFANGVAGTTTEHLQRAGGISPSQIYHYFGDKKSLIRAVIAVQTEAALNAQQPWLSRLDSFEALEAWRDAIIEVHAPAGVRAAARSARWPASWPTTIPKPAPTWPPVSPAGRSPSATAWPPCATGVSRGPTPIPRRWPWPP